MHKQLNSSKRHRTILSIVSVVVLFCFVVFSIVFGRDQVLPGNVALAEGKGLLTIFADGQKKTVATNARTIGEALEQNGINIAQGDVVEPSLETEITQPIYNINVYRAYPAVVIDGNTRISTLSGYRSPRQVVAAAGLKLYNEDKVNAERSDNFVGEGVVGQKITIERAMPVKVSIGGKTFEFRTWKQTVRELLAEKGIDLQPSDQLNVAPDAKLSKGTHVVVSRLSQDIVSVMEVINPEVQYVDDPNQPASFQEVKEPGAPGQKLVTYAVQQRDGIETGRTVVDTKVVQEAKVKVVLRGTKRSNDDMQSEGWQKLRFCESGGNYANKRNPLYRGAYQFDYATWNNYGGYYDPADAPPAVQDAKAADTYRRRGASPWPLCGRFVR